MHACSPTAGAGHTLVGEASPHACLPGLLPSWGIPHACLPKAPLTGIQRHPGQAALAHWPCEKGTTALPTTPSSLSSATFCVVSLECGLSG